MIRWILTIFLSALISQEAFNGYTLFTPYGSEFETFETMLMDNDYNVIHEWSHDFAPASMPYLLQDGSIIYPYLVEYPTMTAGGVGGGIQKVSWEGTIDWDYTFADSIYQHHHDVEPLPNGNILVVVWEKKMIADAYAMGRSDIDQWSTSEMWSTAILELNPVTGSIDWEWHLWDHLIQDVSPEFGAFYGNISDHPELFDINCGSVGNNAGGPQDPNGDWIHINSIDYNPDLDQIAISSRLQGEVYIIDHSTTTEEAASHIGGNSGKGGDILYRWGNPQNYGRGDTSDQILNSQHSINWIPSGYPGEGNFIVFNNFHSFDINNPSDTYSSVIEFSPPIDENGNYHIVNNAPFGPEDSLWESYFYPAIPMQGGSFRLPNGNTLVTLSILGKIVEINNSGDNIWDYTCELELENAPGSAWIARANKYSIDYLQNTIPGDVNLDGILNILDMVLIVNMIIENEYNLDADVNEDQILNILDIVILVNILIGN